MTEGSEDRTIRIAVHETIAKMKGDSIPTPDWLRACFPTFEDPYPLNGEGPTEPSPKACVWVNPGFSRKEEAIENAIRWHQEGHVVICYLPIETSTRYAKRLLQYGVRRLYFERRPYEGCRGIELIILTGDRDSLNGEREGR